MEASNDFPFDQEDQITVAYDTMWEGTAKLAHEIAAEIHRQSPRILQTEQEWE